MKYKLKQFALVILCLLALFFLTYFSFSKVADNGHFAPMLLKDFDEEKAAEILSEKEITVEIRIQEGNEKATAWGCDLSHEYVSINGDYRS